MQLSHYRLGEKVYSGTASEVYGGIRLDDKLPVIIKLMRNERPTSEEIARFRW